MSTRKQTYTQDEMVAALLKMDAQIIDGSDIFKQAAEMIEAGPKRYEPPLDANGKRPYMFYYEDAENCWTPLPELTEQIVSYELLSDGETMDIEFKRCDMTPEQFAAIPEI